MLSRKLDTKKKKPWKEGPDSGEAQEGRPGSGEAPEGRPNSGYKAPTQETSSENSRSRSGANSESDPSTGFGNGGKEPPKAWWSRFGTASTIVTAGAAVMGIFLYPHVKMRWDMRKVLNTPFVFEKPDNYVEREEIREKIKRLILSKSYRTLVVAGSRGVGKSTAVLSALEGETGVMCCTMSSYTATAKRVFSGFLKELSLKASADDPVPQLQSVLDIHKKRGNKVPCLVIEITTLVTDRELRNVLNVAKYLGSDYRLAKVIVVVSTELSAYDVGVAYEDIRCDVVYVPSATDDEAKQYFEKLFTDLESKSGDKLFTKSDIGPMVEYALGKVDRRFLSFRSLVEDANYSTIKDVEDAILRAHSETLVRYSGICCRVLDDLKVTTSQSSPRFKFLQDLSNGDEISRRDLVRVYNIDEEAFNAVNHKEKPHPFFVNVITDKVKISSNMMAESLKEELRRCH